MSGAGGPLNQETERLGFQGPQNVGLMRHQKWVKLSNIPSVYGLYPQLSSGNLTYMENQ